MIECLNKALNNLNEFCYFCGNKDGCTNCNIFFAKNNIKSEIKQLEVK